MANQCSHQDSPLEKQVDLLAKLHVDGDAAVLVDVDRELHRGQCNS